MLWTISTSAKSNLFMILIRIDELESILVWTIIKITIFTKYAFLYAISTQFQFWLKIYDTEVADHADNKSSWENNKFRGE